MSPKEAVWRMKGRETLTQDSRDVCAVAVLVSEIERLWERRSDLTLAFAHHAAEEGQDCCGAEFAGVPGASICASWRRVFAALGGDA